MPSPFADDPRIGPTLRRVFGSNPDAPPTAIPGSMGDLEATLIRILRAGPAFDTEDIPAPDRARVLARVATMPADAPHANGGPFVPFDRGYEVRRAEADDMAARKQVITNQERFLRAMGNERTGHATGKHLNRATAVTGVERSYGPMRDAHLTLDDLLAAFAASSTPKRRP